MEHEINIEIDDFAFDDLQIYLVERLVRSIKSDLERGGIQVEAVEKLTFDIAFTVAAMFDSSTVMEKDGVAVRPYVTFSLDEDRTQLLATKVCTSMHEHVAGTVDNVFYE